MTHRITKPPHPPPHLPTCLVQTPSPPAPPLLREHLTALGFAAAVTAILFSPAWGRVLFSRDLLRYFYPGVFFYRQSLLAGWIPLWNPSLYLGYPFLAELSNGMVLYPLRLLHLFFSAALGIKVFAAVHYLLAGYLMWRLLREWGLTQLPALFGGLCWMGSGYLVSQYLNLSYLAPGVWYPGLLFCFHRLLRTFRLRWFAATGLCWALFLLGGDPQAFLFAGILLLFDLAASFPEARSRARSAPLLAATGVVTLFLVLAQLLPSLELAAWCGRLGGFPFEEATLWSYHPWRLLEWVWPGLWGAPFYPEHFWARFFRLNSASFWAGAVYLGLFPLLLGLVQCRHFRERRTGFLAGLFLFFLLLGLGDNFPLYRLAWTWIPLYRMFQSPEKHLAVASFALAGLAAFGFQRLLAPEQQPARRIFFRGWLVLTVVAAGVWGVLLAAPTEVARAMADYLQRAYQFGIAPEIIQASWIAAAGRTAAVAAGFLPVLWLGSRCRKRIGWIALVLLLGTAAELLALDRTYLVSAPPSLYTFEPEASRRIHEAQAGAPERFRLYRRGIVLYPPGTAEPQGPANDLDWTYWNRNTLLSDLALPEGLEEIFGYLAANLKRQEQLEALPVRLETYAMLNVKYLLEASVTCGQPANPALTTVCRETDRRLSLQRNPGYFPRAFFVDGVRPARDEAEALRLLEVTDFRSSVILRQPAAARPGTQFLPARIQSYGNREVQVEVDNPAPGYLVLSDSYFPGWEARVDGRPARILCANYLVRAVALAAGRHQVVFSYRPWPWRIGSKFSLVSGLLLLGMALGRRRSPRAGAPS